VGADRGSATVWAAAVSALVWVASTAAVSYGTAAVGRHRAETAADLAALAAALRVPDGEAAACESAAIVASYNGGALRGCRIAGQDVEVEVSRRLRIAGLGVRTALARARAGPVDPDAVPR